MRPSAGGAIALVILDRKRLRLVPACMWHGARGVAALLHTHPAADVGLEILRAILGFVSCLDRVGGNAGGLVARQGFQFVAYFQTGAVIERDLVSNRYGNRAGIAAPGNI